MRTLLDRNNFSSSSNGHWPGGSASTSSDWAHYRKALVSCRSSPTMPHATLYIRIRPLGLCIDIMQQTALSHADYTTLCTSPVSHTTVYVSLVSHTTLCILGMPHTTMRIDQSNAADNIVHQFNAPYNIVHQSNAASKL